MVVPLPLSVILHRPFNVIFKDITVLFQLQVPTVPGAHYPSLLVKERNNLGAKYILDFKEVAICSDTSIHLFSFVVRS